MIITQQMPPIHPDDKKYRVTLRPQSLLYPWDRYFSSWESLDPETILNYRSIASVGVPANEDKIVDKEYDLYLSRHAMVEFGMVLFYFRYPRHIVYEVGGEMTRICGWHVLMVDVAQHEKIN